MLSRGVNLTRNKNSFRFYMCLVINKCITALIFKTSLAIISATYTDIFDYINVIYRKKLSSEVWQILPEHIISKIFTQIYETQNFIGVDLHRK
jgi:hypothetical protein